VSAAAGDHVTPALFAKLLGRPEKPLLPTKAVIYSGRSRQNTFIAGSFAALRQRCWLKLLCYLSSTNLPVFVNQTYLTMNGRSWLFMLTLLR
jgi:hypothetical protein